MENKYINHNFFDINNFAFKEILEDKTPWESIMLINDFITALFNTGKLKANYQDKKFVYLGEGSSVHPSVEIEDSAIIGANTQIKHAALLRGACLIGNNVIIGHAVELKHTIVLDNASISHLNYIGDSVIGNNVNIAGGTILANYRLDKKNVFIKSGVEKTDTRLQKFGCAVGDNTVVGVNSVINPGTILGKNSSVFPLQSVSGVYPDNSRVFKGA